MIVFALPLLLLLGLFLLLIVFVLMIELRVLSYAYRKIGVPPRYMFAVLVLSLVGAHVNLPLYVSHGTVVAINVGGALVPILLSLYLFFRLGLQGRMLIGTAIVIFVFRATPSPGPGATWWMIDQLKFDQHFLGDLKLCNFEDLAACSQAIGSPHDEVKCGAHLRQEGLLFEWNSKRGKVFFN